MNRKEYLEKLESFKGLPRGWNGYDAPPPPHAIVEKAKLLAPMLEEVGIWPRFVSPPVRLGIGLSFYGEESRYAELCVAFEDGYRLLLDEVDKEDGIVVREVPQDGLKDALREILEFVGMQENRAANAK